MSKNRPRKRVKVKPPARKKVPPTKKAAGTHQIRPELLALGFDAVPIDTLHTHPQNVRQGDVGAISQSLEHHGQYRPIGYQKSSRYIFAGNHTYMAAKALGWTHICAVALDYDDDETLRALINDNRSSDLASYDDAGLAELLTELAATDLGLAGTLYDADDLERLISDLNEPLATTHVEFDIVAPDPNAPCKLCGRSPLDDDPKKKAKD